MDNNHFYHWSEFKGMPKADLVNVLFHQGAGCLIVSGTIAMAIQVEDQCLDISDNFYFAHM
jgi:hypothetical protein